MNILGLSCGFHDAAASVINTQGDILFAAHSERYSGEKNDPHLHPKLLEEATKYGIDRIAYYEIPWMKQWRRWYSGEKIEWGRLTVDQCVRKELGNTYKSIYDRLDHNFDVDVGGLPTYAFNHHLSHAAAGFQTSPFDRATVIVIDAIGEWDTISIYGAKYDSRGQAHYKKLWGQKYPHSIGLFYSAMTKRVGLKPNEDEYILMGMASYGFTTYTQSLQKFLVEDLEEAKFKFNLHIGVDDNLFDPKIDKFDIAAASQQILEKLVYRVLDRARNFKWSENLVYMGGVALNCVANRNLGDYFDKFWIMPNPGDAGSSLGAAALAYGGRLNWNNAYLGHEISGAYPTKRLLDSLLSDGIVGVASGRAEFGPRALGNRSLLADPRGSDIKDRVNDIKQRQRYRPFAPVILAELADQYFTFIGKWTDSDYMQSIAICRAPDLFPAICHIDGTSRVQTVKKDGSGIRELLEKWFVMTGCPMLLNTSLNIKGEPMVNTRADADRFEKRYGVKVHS